MSSGGSIFEHRSHGMSAALHGLMKLVEDPFGVRAARRLAVWEGVAPIDSYLRLSASFSGRIVDLLGAQGPSAPLSEDVRERALNLVNSEMVDVLAIPGRRARAAADRIDAELARRLEDAESAGTAIIGLLNVTPAGVRVGPLLGYVAEIRQANARVVERLRQLLR